MSKKQENTKKPLFQTSTEAGKLKASVKGVAGEIEGGMGGILLGHLTAEEHARLEKKIKDVGLKAYKAHDECLGRVHKMNAPDITHHIPAPVEEDPMATREVQAYSTSRNKLRIKGAEVMEKLSAAIDKAFTSTVEADWDALNKPIKEANQFVADADKQVESSKGS